MSDYKQLKEKAKALGLKYVGLSTEKLEASIKEAEANQTLSQNNEKKDNIQEQKNNTSNETVLNNQANCATVLDESREVRKFTLDMHGENFLKIAEKYAESRGYSVKAEYLKPKVTCPACGHSFNP